MRNLLLVRAWSRKPLRNRDVIEGTRKLFGVLASPKENRLQEALKAIDKATEGSHLHNQVVMISSSYSEYAQANRTATQDFQTLEMQRAKITNSLLSFLDELSPEDFEKAAVPRQPYYQQHAAPKAIQNKWYLYAGAALILFIILYFATSGDSEMTQPVEIQSVSTEVAPPSVQSPADEGTTVIPQQNAENTINGNNVSYIGYNKGHFIHKGNDWIEETDAGAKYRFKEIGTEDCCVRLRDDNRKMDILIDLEVKRITFKQDNGGSSGFIGNITDFK